MTTIDTISAATAAPPPPPPSIFDRLRAITIGKRRTAKELHFRMVRKVAAGYKPSDRECSDWHDATERAGFTDADTQAHITLHQRLAATEALAATLPTVRREMETAQDKVNAIDAEIAELGTKRAAADNLWRQKLSEFSNASSANADVEPLRQQIADLSAE